VPAPARPYASPSVRGTASAVLVGASSAGFALLTVQEVFGPPITIPVRGLAASIAILAVGLGSLAAYLGLLGGAIAVPMWTHRCSRNLPSLGSHGHLSPALAAASWLVPVANLVLPWVALRDLWLGSGPVRSGGWLVGAWWAAWLAAAAALVAGYVAPSRWIGIALLLSQGLLAVAGALIVVLVTLITRRQDARASGGF
jgi:hypothetical protein